MEASSPREERIRLSWVVEDAETWNNLLEERDLGRSIHCDPGCYAISVAVIAEGAGEDLFNRSLFIGNDKDLATAKQAKHNFLKAKAAARLWGPWPGDVQIVSEPTDDRRQGTRSACRPKRRASGPAG